MSAGLVAAEPVSRSSVYILKLLCHFTAQNKLTAALGRAAQWSIREGVLEAIAASSLVAALMVCLLPQCLTGSCSVSVFINQLSFGHFHKDKPCKLSDWS